MRGGRRWFLWLLAILTVLSGLEGAGRMVGMPILPPPEQFVVAPEWRYPDQIARDPVLFWRYRPNRTIHSNFFAPGVYTINSHGFRTPEFLFEKTPGTTRVVCLGESTTFGYGVANGQTYPRKLEEYLNAHDEQKRRWEVISLGVTDYSTYQGVRLAEQMLPRLTPDIVLMLFSWGDLQPGAAETPDSDLEMPAAWTMILQDMWLRSAIVRHALALRHKWGPARRPIEPGGLTIRRVPGNEYAPNIEKICLVARRIGARSIVLTPPIAWPPAGYSDDTGIFKYHHRYHQMARYGATLGHSPFIELAAVFDRHPEFFDDTARDFAHFNAAGHAYAGEYIGRTLLSATPPPEPEPMR
ncbi:MAG TPA: GDSL-type esterase/lipase family protein [candidate division Zixibacteria bacterium]|jgi:lysophospholipase L1-like esterase